MPTPLISLTDASKSFGKLSVLKDLSLTIEPGELVVVLGTNGAGKTTLLRVMAGLLGLDAGELLITGEKLDRFSEKQREKLFFLPDFPAFFVELSVMENIEVWLTLYSKKENTREKEVISLLERFQLIEKIHQPVGSLSRGQLFKLAMVCYEAVEAPIGLFDEPFASGMDASGLREMKKLIRAATENDRSVIYTTQLVSYALDFADRVLVIEKSDLYFDGPPDEFLVRMESGDEVLSQFSEKE